MAPFYSLYFDTDRARKFIELNRVSSAGQNTVSQGTLLSFQVPLPPINEQDRIIGEVERRLSVVQELEQAVSASLKRAARLRQAILKRAFEGRLV
jgi:type I restriction enzyme S subunit